MKRITASTFALLVLMLPACDSGGENDNRQPSANFSSSPRNPMVGAEVIFSAEASDTDGEIVGYSWDFDDDGDQDAGGSEVTRSFDVAGDTPVTLTVTDDQGATGATTRNVNIVPRPTQATITSVTVEDMPFTTPEGEGWDSDSGPDVFVPEFGGSSLRSEDVVPSDLPITFDDAEFVIGDVEDFYSLNLFDFDEGGNQKISGVAFSVQGLEGGGVFPETATLDTDELTLEISLEYDE